MSEREETSAAAKTRKTQRDWASRDEVVARGEGFHFSPDAIGALEVANSD